jgi:Bifunctional DNA primase/polymerase, N-terminal/Primase C terminal 1 (PriCT-1)
VSAHGTGFCAEAGGAAPPGGEPGAWPHQTDTPSLVEEALRLHDFGLAVVPAPADDGKSVEGTVKGFQNWRRRLPRGAVERLFTKHPGACIALLVGHCGLVVVDCDDDGALAVAEARYGRTPILVRTPSGRGGHLYYRAPTETVRQANLRKSEGLAIDVKAGRGAYVIAPSSVRPSNGIAYAFERGGWDELRNLPVFKATTVGHTTSLRKIAEGSRNDHLFHHALRLAPNCETEDELAMKLHIVNEAECDPPMRQEHVEKAAASAWRYQVEGRNWVGQGRYAKVPEARFERLADVPDAFALDTRMRLTHAGRRDRFAASPKAMAVADVLPAWPAARYRKAILVLVERGVWTLLKRGGRGAGDPHEYGFADCSRSARKPAPKGTEIEPNTNRTPRPAAPAAETVAQFRKKRAA